MLDVMGTALRQAYLKDERKSSREAETLAAPQLEEILHLGWPPLQPDTSLASNAALGYPKAQSYVGRLLRHRSMIPSG